MVKHLPTQCGRPGVDPWVGKIPWRRKWQPTPVFLSGKSHGWRSLVGYSPWGHKELDMTEWLHFPFLSEWRGRGERVGEGWGWGRTERTWEDLHCVSKREDQSIQELWIKGATDGVGGWTIWGRHLCLTHTNLFRCSLPRQTKTYDKPPHTPTLPSANSAVFPYPQTSQEQSWPEHFQTPAIWHQHSPFL